MKSIAYPALRLRMLLASAMMALAASQTLRVCSCIPCAALAYAPCFSNDGACRVTNPPGLLLNSLPCPQPQSSHWALPRPLLVSVDSFRFLWPFRPSLHWRAGCFTHPPENLLWILMDCMESACFPVQQKRNRFDLFLFLFLFSAPLARNQIKS